MENGKTEEGKKTHNNTNITVKIVVMADDKGNIGYKAEGSNPKELPDPFLIRNVLQYVLTGVTDAIYLGGREDQKARNKLLLP